MYDRVLITGGAGCIGMAVCRELAKRGIDMHLFDLPEQVARVKEDIPSGTEVIFGSILDGSSLRDAIAGCDAVIHLAAYLGVRRTETNRLRCLEININGTKNVLDCAVQDRVRKIVIASSSEVYGEPLRNPIMEGDSTQGKSVYAVSKLAGEELCKSYNQRYPNLAFTILRYFNTFGPFQVAQFVIPKFIRSVIQGKSPVIYGDGSQIRSYCYSSDVARGTVEALLREETNGEIFNLGNSKNPVSLTDLAKTVIRLCGKDGEIELAHRTDFDGADRTRDREVFTRFCDTTKAREMLGYMPKVALEEGIKKLIERGTIEPKWATSDVAYTVDDWV